MVPSPRSAAQREANRIAALRSPPDPPAGGNVPPNGGTQNRPWQTPRSPLPACLSHVDAGHAWASRRPRQSGRQHRSPAASLPPGPPLSPRPPEMIGDKLGGERGSAPLHCVPERQGTPLRSALGDLDRQFTPEPLLPIVLPLVDVPLAGHTPPAPLRTAELRRRLPPGRPGGRPATTCSRRRAIGICRRPRAPHPPPKNHHGGLSGSTKSRSIRNLATLAQTSPNLRRVSPPRDAKWR